MQKLFLAAALGAAVYMIAAPFVRKTTGLMV